MNVYVLRPLLLQISHTIWKDKMAKFPESQSARLPTIFIRFIIDDVQRRVCVVCLCPGVLFGLVVAMLDNNE